MLDKAQVWARIRSWLFYWIKLEHNCTIESSLGKSFIQTQKFNIWLDSIKSSISSLIFRIPNYHTNWRA